MASTDQWYFTYRNWEDWTEPWPVVAALGSGVAYLVLVYVIGPMSVPCDDAQPGVKSLWKAHNILLFLFSLVSCSSTFWYLVTTGEITDFKRTTCTPLPPWMYTLSLWFLYSKIYEWLDTMFLVWLKKKLIFLHVYHHATTFWLFLHVTNFPGCAKMGLLLNGGVHTLMYAHYAWPFPKPLVPLITVAQLAQLFYVTYMWSVTPATCGGRYVEYMNNHWYAFLTPYAMVPVYIIFFLKFFVQRFVLGTTHKKKRSPAKDE